MDSFRWDQNYVTGIDEVDHQHMNLVGTINRLGELVANADVHESGEIGKLLRELAEYADVHFTDEERLMRDMNIDARHLQLQEQQHRSFREEVALMGNDLESPDQAGRMLRFLVHWLAYHILDADQSMARQIMLIREGQSPEAAYATDRQLGIKATEPLLTALHGLFQLVSDRNRELHELNRSLEAKVAERTQELALANRHLEEMSLTDMLTGLPNRRHAMRQLDTEWARSDTPLGCMMIDGDGFKTINDEHGHDAGDAVLKALGQRLRNTVRTDDLACRLGGDEFFVVCPATDLEGTLQLAEKIRAAIAELRVPTGGDTWCGSVSIGIAARTAKMQGCDDLIKAADEGVYLAKKRGRNRVACAQR